MESPLVSIQCLVFNHEPYLRKCLDGFVMQKTNFKFEAIVHDDKSTDGSAKIIAEYAEKYPEIIRPIYETENQYSKRDGSLERIINDACRGKYIALCEGDDYWIDPLKLQNQVDYLNSHPDIGLCYTPVYVYSQSKEQINGLFGGPYVDFSSIFNQNCIPTPTVIMRRELYALYQNEIQPNKYSWKLGDLPIWLWFAYRSKIVYLDKPTATYRVLDESACHSSDVSKLVEFTQSYHEIRKLYNNKFNLGYSEEYFQNALFIRRLYLYSTHGYSAEFFRTYKDYILLNYANILRLRPYYYMLLLLKRIIFG